MPPRVSGVATRQRVDTRRILFRCHAASTAWRALHCILFPFVRAEIPSAAAVLLAQGVEISTIVSMVSPSYALAGVSPVLQRVPISLLAVWSVVGCVFQMHEKAQETEECEEAFQAAAKKFRHSKKVTLSFYYS